MHKCGDESGVVLNRPIGWRQLTLAESWEIEPDQSEIRRQTGAETIERVKGGSPTVEEDDHSARPLVLVVEMKVIDNTVQRASHTGETGV